jgi:Zn-dependent peptidase ImmA (M78 family)
VLCDVIGKQDWWREYLQETGADSLDFIGKYSARNSFKTIARDIARRLEIDTESGRAIPAGQDFLGTLSDRAEAAGIWIMRNGKVGFNTHRKLNVEEFRGFAVSDPLAPVVFINAADAHAAQVFTLIHELAHLWIGASGISDMSLQPVAEAEKTSNVEKLCNQVAAEVLVPEAAFQERWQDELGILENAKVLRRVYHVSEVVIARRALDRGMISREVFFDFYNTHKASWEKKKAERGSGGNFYHTLPIVNGRRFTEAVLHSVYSDQLLMRDGARLLGVKPRTLDQYARECGIT